MISSLKKIFSIKKNKNNKPAIDEKKYGRTESLKIVASEGIYEYTVGEEYPIQLPNNTQGETLTLGDIFIIDLCWPNITPNETTFLHSLCEAMSIYKDDTTGIVMLIFVFSGRPVIITVAQEEEVVSEWVMGDYDIINAYFFLIEATNIKIQQIRNLGIPNDFVQTLQSVLIGYKQYERNVIQQFVAKMDMSDIFRKSAFRWIYSEEREEFLFIPPNWVL